MPTPEHVTIETSDGVLLAGLFVEPIGPAIGSVLLLHMMTSTKESWLPLMGRLADRGLRSLAVDLRGHGGSRMTIDRRELDYRDFTPVEQQAKRLDVEASVRWLVTQRGVEPARLALVGASIGANLAIRHAAEHHEIPAAAALSPGLDYRGVTTPDAVSRLAPDQALFLAASRGDDHASWEAVHELAAARPGVELVEFEGDAHGTAMAGSHPELVECLVAWIVRAIGDRR